jgi:hypothetical protein
MTGWSGRPVGSSPRMRVEVEAVRQVTDELADAAGRLLPSFPARPSIT